MKIKQFGPLLRVSISKHARSLGGMRAAQWWWELSQISGEGSAVYNIPIY